MTHREREKQRETAGATACSSSSSSPRSAPRRPKIISKDGNLVFESGANRNISFRLNGNSRLIINGEYDVMDILMPLSGKTKRPGGGGGKDEWTRPEDIVDIRELADQLEDFRKQSCGPNGHSALMRQLQNRLVVTPRSVEKCVLSC